MSDPMNILRPQRLTLSKRGVALIVVVGVLVVLAALTTAFFTLTVMQTKSAVRYADSVRAEMMARAGVEDAIARLRAQAYIKTEDPSDPWYTVDWLNNATKRDSFLTQDKSGVTMSYTRAMGSSVGPDSDRYTLHITDAASKININACDNLAVVLDNLCRVVGPPLVAADQDALIPMRWKLEGFAFGNNPDDTSAALDAYYQLDSDSRPTTATNDGKGPAKYGDGYAIAGYRSRHGRFQSITDVKNALTFVKRNTGNAVTDRQLEQLEREVKFAALREYITVDSWVDTNTICVGKFEWVTSSATTIAIDRDKSWVADDTVNDPQNNRGSLRGSYLSILNGHGAGQLRRIKTNGIDWVEVENGFAVNPGPISSYMIIAREDAPLVDKNGNALANPPPPNTPSFPQTDPGTGTLIDDPNTDYVAHPLCIHRSPVNINTASDKVLEALFLGLNVQYGNPMAVGTDADLNKIAAWPLRPRTAWNGAASDWKVTDYPTRNEEAYLLTPKGLKRIPADSGKLVLNRAAPTADPNFSYLANYGKLGAPNFVPMDGVVNEAHELAYRILVARQRTKPIGTADPDPNTADPFSGFAGDERGPFKSWDDFYFRVVKPWDDIRSYPLGATVPYSGIPAKTGLGQASLARMIMANFNSNADILKFNPNIEWIDRWGRNFTEMEPLMAYTNSPEPHTNPTIASPITNSSIPVFAVDDVATTWINGIATYNADVFLKPFGTAPGTPDAGSYIIRNFRYKSDEMLDKSDLNRSTTEFVFDSAGIYDIECAGQVVNNHEVLAERRVEALVKVYDVWRETTQRQFAQGKISKAAPTDPTIESFAHSGSVTRDAINVTDKLALTTLPEPLVPLKYTINNPNNAEVVDRGNQARDGWGNPKANLSTPDVVANRVQPAAYDGQISLATNTLRFDPQNDKDSFLASFNGDLDTDTAAGNGREQAKIPHLPTSDGDKYRVVNTCSLLGLLDDKIIDIDQDLPAANPHVYRFPSADNALKGLDPNYYWNNVCIRSGDLRPEGVFLGGPGVSGAKSTLKYLFDTGKKNFQPGDPNGALVTMWFKPTWHWNDHRSHEFFNASNPSNNQVATTARACYLTKWGNMIFAGNNATKMPYTSAESDRNNDLNFELEGQVLPGEASDIHDWDLLTFLHGGYAHVYPNMTAPQAAPGTEESPQYRVQPFRWSYVGARWRYGQWVPRDGAPGFPGERSVGHWINFLDGTDPENEMIIGKMGRPFINTQCYPETPTGIDPDFWFQYNSGRGIPANRYFDGPCDIGDPGTVGKGEGEAGQDAKWSWADPAGVLNEQKVFSINNINKDEKMWIYRHLPCDGTYAVIDELKISTRESLLQDNPNWAADRAVKEQQMSRYYLPPNPASTSSADPNGCPSFTSESLLQSLQGYDKSVSAEEVAIVRVSWTAFTPRFMHENKMPTFTRSENFDRHDAGQAKYNIKFKGPFDYVRYNDDSDTSAYSVNRPPPPLPPLQSHATKGVEIELLDGNGVAANTTTYVDPDTMNAIGSLASPVKVRTDKLHYRVRFRYPIDPNVDPAGGSTVDPNKHYLLDTPVFDDISVVYVTKPRILAYREVTE
jgi:hypothetical protein